MARVCEGRVVLVTGAGRGLGREYALEFARQGAKVVVNDLGTALDGSGSSRTPAEQITDEIRAMGAEAMASAHDVADWDQAADMVESSIEQFGRLDVVVNNAGILRDRTLANMTVDEWDAVIHVHLRGTFCPTRHAVTHWRNRSKSGEQVNARLINTASPAVFGHVGQANYGAAKSGIIGFTLTAALELGRYGVTANAVLPGAATRMTATMRRDTSATTEEGEFDRRSPANIAPLVAWLGGNESADITGRVFAVRGGQIGVIEGWALGPSVEQDRRWDVDELSTVVPDLVKQARPNAGTDGRVPSEVG
jgi:NAD(P)-dependent dehydrogenase (short-subunit alcohol dehydrogenase family)